MQKKIIALAIAGLSATSAFAADTVTIYGVADMYVARASADGVKNSTQINSGGLAASRLGFKGVEDLGSGLKALFVLESGLNVDVAGSTAGNSGLFGSSRQAMVGLTGDFGTAVAGRLQTTGYDWAVAYDVTAGTQISPLQNFATNRTTIGATNTTAARANNAVAYISPSFGGVTLAANYSTAALAAESLIGNAALDNTNAKATLLSAKYDNGPLSVGVVYSGVKTETTIDQKDWALGASYNFGVATLKATYQSSKDKTAAVAGTIGADADKIWSVGVAAPVTAAGTVVASYAKAKMGSDAAADNTAKSWTVAYLHALSKRTTAYTGYNKVNNDANVGFSVVNNAYGQDGTSATKVGFGSSSSVFVAGVNHKF